MLQLVALISAMMTLTIPILLLVWMFKTRATTRMYLLSLTLLTVASLIVIRVVGHWSMVGVFWPPVFLIAFLGVVVLRWRQGLPKGWFPRRWSTEFFLLSLSFVGTLALTTIFPNIILARSYVGEAIDLTFPLRGGTFYVLYGGATSAVNPLHRLLAGRQQQFALDLTQLNALGFRASGLNHNDLTKFRIFGAEVVAPCDGEVIATKNNLPNQPIHEMDLTNAHGNHVTLFCGEVTVVLAHLEQGSIPVVEGDHVSTEQPIGQIGNSGSTFEPHLHIHAVRGRHPETHGREGVPIEFDGRFLIKDDWLTN